MANDVPYKGHEGELIKDGNTIGFVTSFSLEQEPNLEGVFEMGSRTAVTWKKGNKEISGTLDRLYCDQIWITDVDSDTCPTYTFKGKTTLNDGTGYGIKLEGVILSSWSWDVPEDDWVTESIDFQAQNITTSEIT